MEPPPPPLRASLPFRFGCLPFVVQQNVLKNFDITQLTFLSFTSTRMRKLIKSIKLAKELSICFMFDECVQEIECSFMDTNEQVILLPGQVFIWNWQLPEKILEHRIDDGLNIGGEITRSCTVGFTKDSDGTVNCSLLRPTSFSPLFLCTYMRELFRVPISLTILITTDILNLRDLAHSLHESPVHAINIKGAEVRARELEFFMSHVNVQSEFTIMCGKVIGRINMESKLFQLENLLISDASNITFNHLMKFSGRHGAFVGVKFTTDDIIQFIEQWKAGGFEKMETFVMILAPDWSLDVDEIIDRLNGRVWDPNSRGQYFKYTAPFQRFVLVGNEPAFKIDCQHSCDFMRTSDNMIGTIISSPQKSCKTVLHGDPFCKYSDDEIWRCLDICQLKEFAQEDENTLDKFISEGGKNMSVGERQLLCLCRALLRGARIVILDEATASVDTVTDAIVQRAIRTHFPKSTTISIAHRLDTIVDSDRIVILDAGRVAEFDTPANLLLNPDSLYSQLLLEKNRKQ